MSERRTRQAEEKLKAGALYEDGGLLFATEVGTPLEPSNIDWRSFKPLLEKAGLPDIRFHDLEYICATTLLKVGQHLKFVQDLLGHASLSLTLDTHSHVLPGMGDGLADAMDDALGSLKIAKRGYSREASCRGLFWFCCNMRQDTEGMARELYSQASSIQEPYKLLASSL